MSNARWRPGAAMQLSSRTVQIPLAGDGDHPGRIALVQADATPPAHNAARLNPQIADLHEGGLYHAGSIALGAVRRLGLRPRGLAPAQWLRPGRLASYLAVTNGPDVLGLAPENSSSAEFGLALALAMHAGQSRDRIVIATGALARETSPDALAADDVAVEPVGKIGRKIAAVVTWLETQRGGAYGSHVLFFLPAKTLTGGETLDAHAKDLEPLAAAFAKQGVKLEVLPVLSLRDAVAKLGVTSLAVTSVDRWVVRGAAALSLGTALLGLGHVWLNAPMKLAFETIELSDGQTAATPASAVWDQRLAAFVMRPACLGAQKLPVFRAGESLVFRAVLRDGRSIDRMLGDYHYAVVGVSDKSGIKVFPQETFGRPPLARGSSTRTVGTTSANSSEINLVLPVAGPIEKNKLIILVRRMWPFDTRALRGDLEAALAGKDASERINVAVAHLAQSAPGYLDYSFLTAEGDSKCEPE